MGLLRVEEPGESGGSVSVTRRSTARAPDGPPPWFPPATAESLRSSAVLGMRWLPGKVVSAVQPAGLRPPVSSTGQALGRACP